jgi:hypothetical protein
VMRQGWLIFPDGECPSVTSNLLLLRSCLAANSELEVPMGNSDARTRETLPSGSTFRWMPLYSNPQYHPRQP